MTESYKSLNWIGGEDGYLQLLDQTLLPAQVLQIECRSVEVVWEAIKMLRVRGAPAIGVSAAYGVLLARVGGDDVAEQRRAYHSACDYLASSRPTAVNLFWALDRMRQVVDRQWQDVAELRGAMLAEARQIHVEDTAMCQAIGDWGASLLPQRATMITHCNAGGLATSDYGTALSIMFSAHRQGKQLQVFADETRPLWQGSRLTAWELANAGIPVTVICDSMAAHVMQTHRVDAVIVGADRITARGDAANKIGTYGLAVCAKHHGVPFYVAAPSSTFDLSLTDGREIPIEQRDPAEIVHPYGLQLAPENVAVYNPAFDVTPAELITAIVTERGVIQPVSEASVRALLG